MPQPRARILERARRLRALTESPNANEAAVARELAAAYCREHGVSAAELADAAVRARGPTFRCAGDADETGAPWRSQLALGIAQGLGCRALLARNKIFFDGEKSADAVARFRSAVAEIEIRARLHWGPRWYEERRSVGEIWRRVLREVEGGALRVTPMPRAWLPDKILLRPGFVVVTSGSPGNYATVFVGPSPGVKLRPRGDMSSHDDGERDYTWVFEDVLPPPAGVRLLAFATADRSLGVAVEGGAVRGRVTLVDVGRSVEGEPHSVDFG